MKLKVKSYEKITFNNEPSDGAMGLAYFICSGT